MTTEQEPNQDVSREVPKASNWRPALLGAAAGIIASLIASQTLTAAPWDLLSTNDTDTTAIEASQAALTTTNGTRYATTAARSSVKTVVAANTATSTPTSSASASRFVIPAGGSFTAKIQTHVSSRDAKVGDVVSATTLENITTADGRIIFPAGTSITGHVVEVRPAAETRSAAVLKVAFTRIGGYATNLVMVTPDLEARAKNANRAADVGLVAGGALAGAVVGHQMNHRRGSEVGAVVGGLTGAVAAANIGANVQLKNGETATLRFAQNLVVD